jgi:hypothetical protein
VTDTQTRGGRPAYELRFTLTNPPVVLSNQHTYLVGFAARTDTQNHGELFVPTASQDGPSDVQAGDLVVGGWRYLVNAGGSTIYSGQLAVELIVAPRINPPRLHITRSGALLRISWPSSAQNFVLEYSLSLAPNADWFPVEVEPFEEDGLKKCSCLRPSLANGFACAGDSESSGRSHHGRALRKVSFLLATGAVSSSHGHNAL